MLYLLGAGGTTADAAAHPDGGAAAVDGAAANASAYAPSAYCCSLLSKFTAVRILHITKLHLPAAGGTAGCPEEITKAADPARDRGPGPSWGQSQPLASGLGKRASLIHYL